MINRVDVFIAAFSLYYHLVYYRTPVYQNNISSVTVDAVLYKIFGLLCYCGKKVLNLNYVIIVPVKLPAQAWVIIIRCKKRYI